MIDNKIVNYNASMIYDNPNSIFIADKKGKLETVSRFNLLGRIIEWLRNLISCGERSNRTAKAITETLEKILENLKNIPSKAFYIQDNDRLGCPFSLLAILDKRVPVHYFQYNHPLDEFADKIIHSSLNKKPKISQIAYKIKEIALPILSSLTPTEKKDLFEVPFNL